VCVFSVASVPCRDAPCSALFPYTTLFRSPDLLPEDLRFLGPEKIGDVPLFLQILTAEVGVEILRMASIHTPSPLATALGLIAAVLLGEMAVKVGLLNAEVMLYGALASMVTAATLSYELGLANKAFRTSFLARVRLGEP